MKKLPAFLTAMVIAAAAHGQINKGQFLVGGTGSFKSSKYQNSVASKSVDFNLSPNIGYFFANKIAGGLRLSFTNSKTELSNGEFKSSSISAAPFVRYYLLPASKKLNVLADASYGFGHSKTGDINKRSFNFLSLCCRTRIFSHTQCSAGNYGKL